LFNLSEHIRFGLKEQCPAINDLLRLIANRNAVAAIGRAFDYRSEIVVIERRDFFRALAKSVRPLEQDGESVVRTSRR